MNKNANYLSLWSERSAYIARTLGSYGFETRKVGGAVRDGILSLPCADEDLCTTATPTEMLELGDKLGIRTIPTLQQVKDKPTEWGKGGLKHGTVPFLINGEVLEITTLRVDTQTDGRHAEVEFVRDFEQDAARRDFTINAMSIDTNGKLWDYFGGLDDLKSGTVKFVGDPNNRICEDYLRILRYFRFHSRFSHRSSNHHQAETLESIRDHVTGLQKISGERIWQEMGKILCHKNGWAEILAIKETGVSDNISMHFTDEDWERACHYKGMLPSVNLGLLMPSKGPFLEQLKDRWKLSVSEWELTKFANLYQDRANEGWRFWLDKALEPRSNPQHVVELLLAFEHLDWADKIADELPVFPIRGSHLLERGMKPGPEMGKSLATLFQEWKASDYTLDLDGLLNTLSDEPPKP